MKILETEKVEKSICYNASSAMEDDMNGQDCGDETEVFKLVGFDKNGVRRVRGCDYTPDGAREQCMQEAVEYVRGRPDTGPLSAWRFEFK